MNTSVDDDTDSRRTKTDKQHSTTVAGLTAVAGADVASPVTPDAHRHGGRPIRH